MHTTGRIRNALLVLTFVLVCSCVCIARLLHGAGVEVPDWTGIYSNRSTLEGRRYHARPELTADSFGDGSFQSGSEQWLSDRIPMRDAVLLGTAAVQRGSISLASAIVGYDTYHTFYGSTIVKSLSTRSLMFAPVDANPLDARAYEARAALLNQLAASHQTMRFFIYTVPSTEHLDESPAARLSTNTVGYAFLQEHLYTNLRGVTPIDSRVSLDEYRSGWARTDHHWNVAGAYVAYVRMAQAMGFDHTLPGMGNLRVYARPAFFGSLARIGRCLDYQDEVCDYEIDLPAFEVYINGTRQPQEAVAHQSAYEAGIWSSDLLCNRYGEYFHQDYADIRLTTSAPRTDKTLLIVADSYTNCMERFFLTEYHNVLVFDPRNPNMSLYSYLSANPEVDDVVFLMSQRYLMADTLTDALR